MENYDLSDYNRMLKEAYAPITMWGQLNLQKALEERDFANKEKLEGYRNQLEMNRQRESIAQQAQENRTTALQGESIREREMKQMAEQQESRDLKKRQADILEKAQTAAKDLGVSWKDAKGNDLDADTLLQKNSEAAAAKALPHQQAAARLAQQHADLFTPYKANMPQIQADALRAVATDPTLDLNKRDSLTKLTDVKDDPQALRELLANSKSWFARAEGLGINQTDAQTIRDALQKEITSRVVAGQLQHEENAKLQSPWLLKQMEAENAIKARYEPHIRSSDPYWNPAPASDAGTPNVPGGPGTAPNAAPAWAQILNQKNGISEGTTTATKAAPTNELPPLPNSQFQSDPRQDWDDIAKGEIGKLSEINKDIDNVSKRISIIKSERDRTAKNGARATDFGMPGEGVRNVAGPSTSELNEHGKALEYELVELQKKRALAVQRMHDASAQQFSKTPDTPVRDASGEWTGETRKPTNPIPAPTIAPTASPSTGSPLTSTATRQDIISGRDPLGLDPYGGIAQRNVFGLRPPPPSAQMAPVSPGMPATNGVDVNHPVVQAWAKANGIDTSPPSPAVVQKMRELAAQDGHNDADIQNTLQAAHNGDPNAVRMIAQYKQRATAIVNGGALNASVAPAMAPGMPAPQEAEVPAQ